MSTITVDSRVSLVGVADHFRDTGTVRSLHDGLAVVYWSVARETYTVYLKDIRLADADDEEDAQQMVEVTG